jgi:hypothetical protein
MSASRSAWRKSAPRQIGALPRLNASSWRKSPRCARRHRSGAHQGRREV